MRGYMGIYNEVFFLVFSCVFLFLPTHIPHTPFTKFSRLAYGRLPDGRMEGSHMGLYKAPILADGMLPDLLLGGSHMGFWKAYMWDPGSSHMGLWKAFR